eukprot:3375935-Rhodomonas_salina.1
MSGTDLAYGGTSLHACCAMPGTEIAYVCGTEITAICAGCAREWVEVHECDTPVCTQVCLCAYAYLRDLGSTCRCVSAYCRCISMVYAPTGTYIFYVPTREWVDVCLCAYRYAYLHALFAFVYLQVVCHCV